MKRIMFVAILVIGFSGLFDARAMASNCPQAPKPKPVVHHTPKPEQHELKTHEPPHPAKQDDDDEDAPPPVVVIVHHEDAPPPPVVVAVTPPTFVDDTPPTVTHEAPPIPDEVEISTPVTYEAPAAPEVSAPVFEQQDTTPVAAAVPTPTLAYTGANVGHLLGVAGIFIACGVMILLTIRAKREN